MTTDRKLALTTGVLYLITFVTSIPALALKLPFLAGGSAGNEFYLAVILEILLALACIGTAVAFYPIGKRHHPALAAGFIASRTLEAATVFFGVIALLSIVTLRGAAAADQATLHAVEVALAGLHDWAFLIGPGLLPAVNALLFGTLLYRSRLVPRIIPLIGLIGAPLLVTSALISLFGLNDQVSALAGIAALPIALWEFTIGVWLIVKGVKPVEVGPDIAAGAVEAVVAAGNSAHASADIPATSGTKQDAPKPQTTPASHV